MHDVRVKKADLIETLKANRKAHVEAFEAVWAAFQRTAAKQAERMLAEIQGAR